MRRRCRARVAHKTIQLGQSGLGAGSKPEKGREAAELAVDDIRAAIDGAHMLFITAGMGGGTGTGAAPVIARVAKEMGILTVGVVTKPFDWEGGRRMTNADQGLAELEANVDSLIVVLNEKLLEVLGDDITQDEAFAHANDVLKNAVGGIAEIINVPGHVNVDFEDVRTVMGEPGKAMMGTAVAVGPGPRAHRRRTGGGLPAARRHRPVGRQGRAGADHRGQGLAQAVRVQAGDEHHPRLRLARRARDLRHGLRRRPGRRRPRHGGRHRPVAPGPAPHGAAAAGAAHRHRQRAVQGADHAHAWSAVPGAAAPAAASQPDYGGMAVPSVWRTNRTQAAAKVDALSSGGMDDFEIPAFLRKQAD